jgi:hypothetical protein
LPGFMSHALTARCRSASGNQRWLDVTLVSHPLNAARLNAAQRVGDA